MNKNNNNKKIILYLKDIIIIIINIEDFLIKCKYYLVLIRFFCN